MGYFSNSVSSQRLIHSLLIQNKISSLTTVKSVEENNKYGTELS